MKPLSEDDRQVLVSLQRAVREALERKCRLGQYAVVWENGHPAFLGPHPPTDEATYSLEPATPVRGVAEDGETS